ncbi:MAG: GNAT family N-acetyltransferase [Caldilineaceae bacterium]
MKMTPAPAPCPYPSWRDARRRRVLQERGFVETEQWGVVRHLRLGTQTLAQPVVAPGYTIRATNPGKPADSQGIADILNAAFNRTLTRRPSTRRCPPGAQLAGLDFVATAPDGTIAAYVGVPYEPHNRLAIFEPVCTHPNHQRRGLAKALMQHAVGAAASRRSAPWSAPAT